jgi:hypothetical protein
VTIVTASENPQERNPLNPYSKLAPEIRKNILLERLAAIWARICREQKSVTQTILGNTPNSN